MKKYFKIGTALALSVLLNLTPTLIPNVHAEEPVEETSIVETVNKEQVYYANQNIFDDSSIPEEEPLEVKQEPANEVSTAEANNIITNEPTRAPTETINVVKAGEDSDPTEEEEEEEKTVTLHLVNTLDGTETLVEVTKTTWSNKTLRNLGLATTMTKDGNNYLFQGWFTEATGGTQIKGNANNPVVYENANIYSTNTGNSKGTVYYQLKGEITSTENIYIYAQWKQELKTRLVIMGPFSEEPLKDINITVADQKSFRLVDLGLDTNMTVDGKDYAFQGWFTEATGGTKLPTSSQTHYATENIELWTHSSNGTIYYKGRENPTYAEETVYVYAQYKQKHYTRVHAIDTHLGVEIESETKSPITKRNSNVPLEDIIDTPFEYYVVGGGSKHIRIVDDDYIYTFDGWYYLDEETGEKHLWYYIDEDHGNNHVSYGQIEFNGVKIETGLAGGTNPGAIKIVNTTSGTVDQLEDYDIYLYTDWIVTENPNVRVKVNFINTNTDEVDERLSIQANDNITKTLSSVIAAIDGMQDDKYNDGEYIYTLDGFYTENGQKITEDGVTINNVSIKYEVVESIKHDPDTNEEIHLFSDGLRLIGDEELIKGEINIYVRWTTSDLPRIEFMDVKDNNTELAYTNTIGGAGIVIGLDQIFTGSNRDGKYSGVKSTADKSETDSNHIYNFIGWYTEETGGEQIGENFTLTGDWAEVFNVLSVNSGENETAPFAITYSSSSAYEKRGHAIPNTIRLYGRWETITAPVLQYRQENNVTLDENESWVNSNGTTSTFTANLATPVETSGEHKFLYWKVYYDDPEKENYGEEYDHVEYTVATEETSAFVYTFQNDIEHSGTEEKLVNRAWWQPALTVILYDTKPARRAAVELGNKMDYKDIILVGENGVLPEPPTKEGYTFVGWFVVETDEAYTSNEVTAPDPSYEKPNEETGVNVPKTVRLYAKWTKEINVTKIWDDADNENNLRPTSVTIEVYASNQEDAIATFNLTGEENTWTSEYVTVEGFDETGTEITYTASENNMPYYNTSIEGLTVTNKLKEEGTVYVEYYDLETNEQFENSRVTLEGIIDTEYTTEAKNFENYTLQPELTEGETTGQFTDTPKTVKYYYSLNSSNVITHYVDQKTNEEFEYSQEETEGKIGTPYETFEKHFLHYELVETPENATGNYAPETIHVYYYYKWIQGVVNIHHYDQTGEELTEFEELKDTISGDVDSPYETTAATIPHYHLVGNSGNIIGTYTEEAITVNYYYEKNEGTVIVHHMDKDTDEEFVEYQETLTGKVEEPYETSSKEIPNYTLDEESLPENATGTYSEEQTDVYYYYIINNGQVNVKYINLETNEEFEDSTETLEGKINSPYETVEKEFENYTMVRVEGETTGTYQPEPIEVTYYYSLNNGTVTVHYVDQKTNEEFTDSQETLTGKIGTTYETVEKEFLHYELVETPENATGEYTAEAIEVTYYYKWMQGTVIVHYMDKEEDSEFTDLQETITGDVDATYETTAKEVEHYTLDSNSGNITGTYTEDTINVYYYYTRNNGTVVVHHMDKDTDTELTEYQETLTGKVESPYETSSKEIPNYTLDEESLPENATGNYSEEQTDVYYYYVINNGIVNVKYINLETEEEFEDSAETLEGKINTSYETVKKEFENYTMVRVEGETTGTYQAEPIEVIYYYSLNNGTVTVHYVDQKTNEEFANTEEVLTGKIGATYETVEKEFLHYELVETPENATGEYTAEAIEVTYYYVWKQGTVNVHYYDQNGETLTEFEELQTTITGDVDSSYETEAADIPHYHLVGNSGNIVGTYTEDAITVNYYYEKNEGTVIVHHIDKDTEEEFVEYQETLTGKVEEEYETNSVEIPNYTLDEETLPENATGTYSEETTDVYYYYVINNGQVIVKYINLETNEEFEDSAETLEGKINTSYETVEKEFENYTMINVDGQITGTYQPEPIEVTYYYSINNGTVIVHYVDKDTEEELMDYQDTLIGKIDSSYETVQKDIPHYTFDSSTENTTGEYTAETIDVTYYYNKNTGHVTVYYVDKNNNEIILDTAEFNGKVEDLFTIEEKTFEDYEWVDPKPEMERTIPEGEEVIYLYYVKHAGNVEVSYIDIKTGEEIADSEEYSGTVDQEYETVQKEIEGYRFVRSEGTLSGNFPDNRIEKVIYYYEAVGQVTVKYLEKNTEDPVGEEIVKVGPLGEEYFTTEITVEGYELVERPENATGTYTEEPIEVIYYYSKMGEVKVYYVDKDNNSLIDEEYETIKGVIGDTYTTEEKEIEGYQLYTIVSDEENNEPNGIITENTKKVTYVYEQEPEEEKTGIVVIKYVDEETEKEISPRDYLEGTVGYNYRTTFKDIENYEYSGVEGEEVGTFSEEEQIVTYYYTKKESNNNNCCNSCCNTCSDNCNTCDNTCGQYLIITKYEDEDGNTIAEDNIQYVAENQQYATKKLVIDGYEFVKVSEDSDPTEGTYTIPEEGEAEPITVTYIYKAIPEEEVEEPKEVTILVQYLDQETNNPVFDSVTLTGKERETYTVTRKAKEGYNLVEPEFEEIGKFSENTTLIYYYEKVEEPVEEDAKTGYVVVKYVDQNGTEIAEKEILSGKIGGFYFTTQKVVDGYIFVEVDEEEEGTFEEDIKRVTYTYEQISEEPIVVPEKGIVVVHYVDTNNNAIADDVVTSEEEGTLYVTSQKMIEGYTFVEKTENYTGKYTNDIIEVTYTYEKEEVEEPETVEEPKDAVILVQYLDSETENPVYDSVTLTGKVGDIYTTTRKAKEGYNLVKPEFEEIGTFGEEPITLTYYYEKVEEETPEEPKEITILVQYLDQETNNPLFDSITLTGKTGDTYTTTRKAKEEYNLVTPDFEEIGEFTENQVFNYYYEKVVEEDNTPETAYVLAHYVDSNGKQIKDDEVYTGNVGDPYVIPVKLIDGYNFVSVEKVETAPMTKAMLRGPVRAESSANIGTFTSGVTELNFNYEEIEKEDPETPEEPKPAMLIVRYQDTDGTAIATDLVVNGVEGDFYDASQKVLTGYKYVSVDGETYGTLPAGITVVTYTYEKVEEEKPEEEGNNDSENNQPIINIEININNENNSDNHSENNNENNVENNSDNHSENNTENTVNNDTNIDDHSDNHTENNINNDTNVDAHSEVNTDVNNETNVDNHNDNTTEVNNDNHTDVNNENNNEDTNEVNIENNPVVNNDTTVENNPVNTVEGNNIENNPSNTNTNTNEGNNIENNPTNSSSNVNTNEGSNIENNPTNSNENNANIENNPTNENQNDNQSDSASNSENNNENTNENNNTIEPNGSEEPTPTPTEPTAEKGMVVVNYLDENDKVLASSVITTGEVDSNYATAMKAIPNYVFVRVEGNENGKYTEGVITVNYYYEPQEEEEPPVAKRGAVVTYYVDQNGKELDKEIIENEVGTNYFTDQKEFEGYDYVTVYGSRNGEIKEGITEVIYLYNQPTTCEDCNDDPEEPVEPTKGTVIVYYVDQNGKELDKETIENEVGKTYTTNQKEFEGYDYVNVYGPKNGEIKEGITEVVYLYNQPTTCEDCKEDPEEPTKGKVIAHYINMDTGARLGYDITQEGNVGEEYATKLRKFRGYTFIQVVGAYAGKYTSDTIEVTYYYRQTEEGGTEPLDDNGTTTPNNDIEIKVPNTGIVENNIYEIITLIVLLLGTMGAVVLKTNE